MLLWIMLAIVVVLVVVADHVLQPPRQVPEPGRERVGAGRRAAEAALRPDPEPRRDRQGLRVARARDLRGRDRCAHARRRQPRDRPSRAQRRGSSARRSAASSQSPRRIPELQADENFRQLQEELAQTENRIAVSRQVYNDTVLTYNTAIQTVPGVFFAGPFGFSKKDFFEVEDGAREAPRVAF